VGRKVWNETIFSFLVPEIKVHVVSPQEAALAVIRFHQTILAPHEQCDQARGDQWTFQNVSPVLGNTTGNDLSLIHAYMQTPSRLSEQ
jgi:hypothetical protein